MEHPNTRRSDRISIGLPVEVFSRDVRGERFSEKTRTIQISRHGAAIVVRRKLALDEEVLLVCVPTGKWATGRVAGEIQGPHEEGNVYGIGFPDTTVNPWSISFPPPSEGELATGRVLLQCVDCRNREVALLNEVELEHFEVNKSLFRSCKDCGKRSLWARTFQPQPSESAAAGVEAKVTACVRGDGLIEDTVVVEDASPQGFSFKSRHIYRERERVEVAVPGTKVGPNVFTPARIEWSRDLPYEGVCHYGVAYIKPATSAAKGASD